MSKKGKKASFEVDEWLVDKKDILKKPVFTAVILHETNKAFRIKKGEKEEWIPKSQVQNVETIEQVRIDGGGREGQGGGRQFSLSKRELAVKWSVEASSRNLTGVSGLTKEEIEENFKKWFAIYKEYLGLGE